MLVFWREKLVFFATPKTGTTALEGTMAPRASLILRDPPDLKHIPVYRFHSLMGPLLSKARSLNDLESVAMVRHPVDWLSSWYRYRHRDTLAGRPNSTRGMSFDDFVREYCKAKPAVPAAVGSQATFLAGEDGNLGVTHLFRYEAMPKLVAFMKERLSAHFSPRKLNVSPRLDISLAPEVRRLLEREAAAEFAVWEQAIS